MQTPKPTAEANPNQSAFPEARRWQVVCVAFVLSTLIKSDHAYIQAPMATGKTLAMLLIGEALDIPGTRLIIVGSLVITDQHKETMNNMGFT